MSGEGDAWDLKGNGILRGKKQRMEATARGLRFSRASGSNNDGTKPSEECKGCSVPSIVRVVQKNVFDQYKQELYGLGEVIGKDAFLGYMKRLFEDTISGEEWDLEKRKPGYFKWMGDKIVDVLHNTKPIPDKYRKQQDVPMNDKELVAFNNKVANFCYITKNWSNKLQKNKGTWHQGIVTEMMLRGGHLICFDEKVKVSY